MSPVAPQRSLEFSRLSNITGQCTTIGCDINDINRQLMGGGSIYGLESTRIDPVLAKGLRCRSRAPIPLPALDVERLRPDFVQFGDVEIADSLPYVADIKRDHMRALFERWVPCWNNLSEEVTFDRWICLTRGSAGPQLLLVDLAAIGVLMD